MDEAVEQILARLIGQFRSPYDFCRELVQNAMDGGAGRVDVSVDVHEDTEQECVMEVRFDDTGRGMTAVVVRDELTRLFASSKRHDRTSAGEFGVGFVSVFGWRPDAVLLQTGREGEAWELIFDGSAQFEQRRVDQPLEGTSVVLLKRVARSALPEVTAKIRDALHRWCRYCPIEITFEDLYSGSAPASISVGWPDDDAICEDSQPLPGGRLVVSMCADPRVVLLRGGLILEEGSLASVFPAAIARLPPGAAEHLRVFAESSDFETNIARDKITAQDAVERLSPRIVEAYERLQRRLFVAAEEQAAQPSSGDWAYAHTMMHLCLAAQLPSGDVIDELDRRPLLRTWHEEQPSTLRMIERGLEGLPLLVAECAEDAERAARMTECSGARFPIVRASFVRDLPWLRVLGASIDRAVMPAARVLYEVEVQETTGLGICGGVETMLRSLGFEVDSVRVATWRGTGDGDGPICGFDPGTGRPFACSEFGDDPRRRTMGTRIWLHANHGIVRAALELGGTDPVFAAMSILAGMSSALGLGSESIEKLASYVEREMFPVAGRRRLGPSR